MVFKDYNPFIFFFFCSLIFFILGLAFGTEPIIEYIKYKYVYKVPTAILATGLMIISLILFAIGAILDTVCKYQKFNYELNILNKNEK